ncbi:micrococcal nuclease [Croceifilum oryzae]|uniref:Micrococcal nuclease n=1 Tax=Croceifilum oryzae TaxID=1553429 RepID=A0AAJ1WV41_9BACL|nr:thermonuclease family protein [Croceifilum oryzae]MDQ0418616.1 micrococcal nuclease [Croceifilum oryzae]
MNFLFYEKAMRRKWMKKKITILVSALCITSLLWGCGKKEESEAKKLEVPSSNITVMDGNTLQVKNSKDKVQTVKLASIEAPTNNQPYSLESKTFLQNFVQNNKKITLDKTGAAKSNKNEVLVYVSANKVSVQEELLKNGFSRVSNVAPPLDSHAKEYQAAENIAKEAKKNIWSLANYVKADGYHPESVLSLFVASLHGDVYHKTTCTSDISQITDTNKIYFKTEQEAMATGRSRSKNQECWK